MRAEVVLNVYDLCDYNAYTGCCGLGIYHTGVEVYNIEYAFGGHDYDHSGIFATRPRAAPGDVVFKKSIVVGETAMTPREVQQLVKNMGKQYKGNKYHLLQMNCNHFADDLCKQLCGRHAPAWINRLAGVAVCLHCLLPVSWVPPLRTPTAAPEIRRRAAESSMPEEQRRLLLPGDINANGQPQQQPPLPLRNT